MYLSYLKLDAFYIILVIFIVYYYVFPYCYRQQVTMFCCRGPPCLDDAEPTEQERAKQEKLLQKSKYLWIGKIPHKELRPTVVFVQNYNSLTSSGIAFSVYRTNYFITAPLPC